MSWIAVGSAAVAVVGGVLNNRAAKKAADQQKKAQQAAIAEQRAAREQLRSDLAPYNQLGLDASRQLGVLNAGDYTAFKNSPDYLWAQQQAIQGADRSAAARGGLYSGGHQADLQDRLAGLASQQLGNYRNNLMGLINVGQTSAAGVGNAGIQTASNIGNAYGNIGNAQAQSALTQGQNYGEMAGAIGGALNNWNQNRLAGRSSYTGYTPTYNGPSYQNMGYANIPRYG